MPMTAGASPVATHLRVATRASHDVVDAAFSRFDLSQPTDYGSFLSAHAGATAAVEAVLMHDPALPTWRPRFPLLASDLASMGLAEPTALPFDVVDDPAWRCGALYVLEGSRLGGAILVKRAFPGAPTAFLSARHEPGEWRTFLRSIEQQAAAGDPHWVDRATAGATACFDLYARASEAKPIAA